MSPSIEERIDCVLAYHTRTKHHFQRYARAMGYMDWDTQPDPFRRYEGTEAIALPHPTSAEAASFRPFLEKREGIVVRGRREHSWYQNTSTSRISLR